MKQLDFHGKRIRDTGARKPDFGNNYAQRDKAPSGALFAGGPVSEAVGPPPYDAPQTTAAA